LFDAGRLVAGEQRGENRDARLGDAHPGDFSRAQTGFDGLLALEATAGSEIPANG